MSPLKIFEKAAPFFALFGALAIIGVVVLAISEAEYANQPSAERDQHAADQEHEGETWTITREEDGSYKAERQTADVAEHEGAFGTPLTAEEIIALFTIALVGSTIGLWWATYQLGDRADRGMRILERAYVLPVLHEQDAETIGQRIDAIMTRSPDSNHLLEVRFACVNFGKTPATITSVMADLRLEGDVFNVREHFVTRPVIGPGQGTNDLRARMELNPVDAAELLIGNGQERLILQGVITFEDVFGREQFQRIFWRYNRRARRLVPEIRIDQG